MATAQSGTPSIDALVPWIGLIDRLAHEAPELTWLVWMLLATGLATIINAAGTLRSSSLSSLLAIPGAALTTASLIFLTLLVHPLVPWTSKLMTLGVACAFTTALVGAPWLLPRDWRPHARAIPLVVLIGRPLLIVAPALLVAVATRMPVAWLAPIVAVLFVLSEIVVAWFVVHVLRGVAIGRSSSDLRQFGSSAPVFVVPEDSFQFLAVTAGFAASTSVFVRDQVERALNGTEERRARAARHVLAHEAAHVLGRHTALRALAIGVVIASTPLVVALVRMPTMTGLIAVGLPIATGAVITLAFEASARRFADRAVRHAPAVEPDM